MDGQTDIAFHGGVKAKKRRVYGKLRREIDPNAHRKKNRSKDAKILTKILSLVQHFSKAIEKFDT